MAIRALCRVPQPIRCPARRIAPSIPKKVLIPRAASKPIQAYRVVSLPSVDTLHDHFTHQGPTQAIVEDPYLDKQELVQQVLINFANREMVHGMIKVELTLMIWSYKNLNLPDPVAKLLIDNLADSLSRSAKLAPTKNQLEKSSDLLSREVRESKIPLLLSQRSATEPVIYY